MSDYIERGPLSPVSAVISPCSAGKQLLPSATLKCTALKPGHQPLVEQAWLSRLASFKKGATLPAAQMYTGAGFRRVASAATDLGAPLFVLSAGLGLVRGTTVIPGYDLTVSAQAADRLQGKIAGNLDLPAWWTAVQRGPFAASFAEWEGGRGRILIALTRPYAGLVGAALATWTAQERKRLRLFGPGIRAHLPKALHAQVVAYSDHLDVLVPGTRLDAASRALQHFASLVRAVPPQSKAQDQKLVDACWAKSPAAAAIEPRRRVCDADLVPHLKDMAKRGMSESTALRTLRRAQQIACEQSRFKRLYRDLRA